MHSVRVQDGQINTGLVCCDYSNTQSHYAFPVSDTEFLVSCRNGQLQHMLVNESPTNDDEKFRA